MSKCFIHIGLPKTATTALQDSAFSQLESNDFVYLGLRHPRFQRQVEEFSELEYIISSPDPDLFAIKRLSRTLDDKFLKKEINVLISEEMLVVDTQTTWQEKLRRINLIFEGFEREIILTLREPLAASFSLFVELYPGVREKWKDFDHFWEFSNQSKIFRYRQFIIELRKIFGTTALNLINFELIKDSDRFLEEFEAVLGLRFESRSLPQENTRRKDSDGVWTEGLKLFQAFRVFESKVGLPNVSSRWLSRSRLGSMIIPFTSKKINYPTARHYGETLQAELDWLKEEYSIHFG